MTKTRDLADLGGGFIQAGTGAVQRTVESKLQDVVSVLDFIPESEHAAIKAGTSTYDATAAIQAAINSIYSNDYKISGGTIFFPNGTYKTTAPIRIPALGEYTLSGEGNSRIKKAGTTAATGLANITTSTGLVVNPNVDAALILLAGTASYTYNLNINRLTIERDTKGTNSYVVFAPCVATSVFDHCFFSGPAVNAFFSTDIWNTTFNRCTFSDCDNGFVVDPLQDSYAGTSLALTSCYAVSNTNGFKLKNILYSELTCCGVDFTGIGGVAYTIDSTASKACNLKLTKCATENTSGRQVVINKGDVILDSCLFSEADCLTGPGTYGNGFQFSYAYVTMNECVHLPKNASDATINNVGNILDINKYRVAGGSYGGASLNLVYDGASKNIRFDYPNATTGRFTTSGNVYHSSPFVDQVIFKNPANYTESANVFPYTNFGNAPANPTSYPIGTLAIDIEYGQMWIRRNDGNWYRFQLV